MLLSNANKFHALQRKSALNIWQSLFARAAIVLTMIGIALLGHWFDRDGLRDNSDGLISFIDVVYFTAVTITTVGYGDIVPVTDRARMFDALVVTPIRIFVWLIFLGTAYDFVFRQTWERIRTAMIGKNLKQHTIVCGFGAGGEFAVRELLRHGDLVRQIVVIDPLAERVVAATALGVLAIQGDATSNEALEAARIVTAKSLLISTNKDDTTALVVLSARQLNAKISISASVRAQENQDLLYQAGANIVINPISFGGQLLARSASEQMAVNYMSDLVSAEGQVLLRERQARANDIGKSLRDIDTGLGVRLLRSGKSIGFWEEDASVIAQGDVIIEIVKTV